MASKEKCEKSIPRNDEDTKKEAEAKSEDTFPCPETSSGSTEKKLSLPVENTETVCGRRADSTPEKSKQETKNIAEILNDIADTARMATESTPPTEANQYERMPPIEGITCSKIKMADIGKNNSSMELTPPVVTAIHQRDSIIERSSNNPSNVAVPRRAGSVYRALPNFDEAPFVLATHLVPSLPIALFEILVEIIETATGQPVVLLYEARADRSVAKNLVDFAVLPVGDDWDEGSLLPVSFLFEHRLNTANSPDVYVDVVVAQDCMRNIEEIIDLRGYRCALPDRSKALGAAALLFRHLNHKGENPSFFGNTLDSGSQLSALQMVAGKQTEIAVLESPVINCHKNTLSGIDSVCVLESLGPLPPYRMMLNKKIQISIRERIIEGLVNAARNDDWKERLGEFGVSGFAEYNIERYDLEDLKSVVTSVPYY